MKKTIITIMAAMIAVAASASVQLVERSFVSTDKSVYVAGDRIWVSVFCLDAARGVPSECSSILYLELLDASSTVRTARIALIHGRGAGYLDIPRNIPTGNYLLVPYTALNANESAYDYASAGRLLSIFNPYLTDRGSVKIVSREQYEAQPEVAVPQCGALELSISQDFAARPEIMLSNAGGPNADVSVSVYHVDALKEPARRGVSDFADAVRKVGGVEYTGGRIPEYEGEIIRAKLDPSAVSNDRTVSLSAPGSMADVYFAPSLGRDTVCFYTGNIYGDKDMVCDIDVELLSPFMEPSVSGIPELELCRVTAKDIYERGAASQIERMFDSDTLYELLNVRNAPLLNSGNVVRYNLDDYTRFPKMEEIFVEFIPDLRVRKVDGKQFIQVLLSNTEEGRQFSDDRALMLIDGVPVHSHEQLLSYDPLLVRTIEIYPDNYYVGYRSFAGIVNFRTYKGNMPEMVFEDGVRIVSFQGAAYPLAYTCGTLSKGSIPDFRQTVFWHPCMKVQSGQSDTINCVLPDYGGKFRVVVEGFAEDGSPIYQTADITVNQ